MSLPPSILNTLRRRLHFLRDRQYINAYDEAEIAALTHVIAHFEQVAPIGRRVVCAALRQGSKVVLGVRHFDAHMSDNLSSDWEAGFIDNSDNFLSREAAWAAAEAAGQVLQRVPGDGQRLYSENLY